VRLLIVKYAEKLRASFWFLPTLMAVGAVFMSVGLVALDEVVTDEWLHAWRWVYSGGAQGASAVLQTIAGSMITIAGVVFSLTLVALSLASSQYGSRLLRNFMRDTMTQLVLGTFVATFLYCLLVLRTIRRAEEGGFVPHLSVTMGVLFAIASLWVLIYFIHHVAVSIQADEMVARVSDDLNAGIDRLFPELGQAVDADSPERAGVPADFSQRAAPLGAPGDGYLQIVDLDALLRAARDADVILRLERRPGQYVVRGYPLVRAWPGDHVSAKLTDAVSAAFVLGSQRTSVQDVEFALQELVEIAVRALSPGINDPFTAIVCVDRIGTALSRLARRQIPSPYRTDEDHKLRIIAPPATFAGIVDGAFNAIRQASAGSVMVTVRLLEVIEIVATAASLSDDQKAVLAHHADMIARGGRAGGLDQHDRLDIEARYAKVTATLRR